MMVEDVMQGNNLEYLLNHATDAFRKGIKARQQGETDKARECLLQAAECLYMAADASHGSLRETRKSLAQKLQAEAEKLTHPTQPAVQRKSSSLQSQSIGGDDQQAESWLVQEQPDVSFDDIAGLDDVKEQIRLKLLYPFTHAETAARYGIQPGGGILLYGPPGTGKTLIARAVAGEIQAAFFAIKPSEVMSQWVGVAEQNVARLFSEASAYPVSVVFIDEMEALAPRRRTSGSTVMQRVVPQLLAELDGFHKRENALLLIGATNEPWAIDGAILRPGRLDRLIYVPPPDVRARARILELNLREAPLDGDISLDAIADSTEGYSGADMAALARRARERAFLDAIHADGARPIHLADFSAILADMRPSIPPQELKRFEDFKRGGIMG